MDLYYDDKKRLIATTVDQLVTYFRSLPGVTLAKNMPFALECPMPALIQVSGSAALPKFIYKNGLAPANRIYPALMQANSLSNINSLCNGVNNGNLYQAPEVGVPQSKCISVQAPEVGVPQSANYNVYVLSITGQNNWVMNPTYTSAVNNEGVVSLNFSCTNTNYHGNNVPFLSNVEVGVVSSEGIPVTPITISSLTNPNLPANSSLLIDTEGRIYYTGLATEVNGTESTLEITGINYNVNQ
jgi:hypothetical protein